MRCQKLSVNNSGRLTSLLVAMLVYGVHRETHCWVRWIDGSCLLKLLQCHGDDSVATARNKYP
jgi:hypothetical protein